jgi:hypothetical protein
MRTFKIHRFANQSAECLKKAEERPPSEGAPGSDSYGRDRWGKLDKAIGWTWSIQSQYKEARTLFFLSGPCYTISDGASRSLKLSAKLKPHSLGLFVCWAIFIRTAAEPKKGVDQNGVGDPRGTLIATIVRREF